MRARRIRKWLLRPILAVGLIAATFVGVRIVQDNFGVVTPGRVYRSAQMPAGRLSRKIREHRVKTVLNLRGANPRDLWYRAECAATLEAGATHVDLSMASDMWLSRAQARTVLQVLDSCEYPILIHCQWGSERTGLVSAIIELLRPEGTMADARREFSLHYLYVKVGDGAAMAEHLDAYEAWLKARRMEHSPSLFRRWVAEDYRPGMPSREYWPYDPYPPVIITRPSSSSDRLARGEPSAAHRER